MAKFDVRICKCGKIHFIEYELIDEALDQDKDLMLVCGGCGTTLRIGADRETDWNDPSKTIFNMYTFEVEKDQVWDASLFESTKTKKGVTKIIRREGIDVPMNTFYRARSYMFGKFQDMWFPDFYKIERGDVTAEEVQKFIAEWRKDSSTVNMNALLRNLTDEQAEALSHYYIEGLAWKGTKFEKDWHK